MTPFEPTGLRTITGSGISGLYMNQSSLTDLRSQLRQSMWLKRQSLTAGQQTQAAESIIPQALSLIELYQASHIAFLFAF